MTKQTKTTQPPDDDEELDDATYAALEKEWRASLHNYSDEELLEIFPEARDIIPEKIAEWKQERAGLLRTIKQQLTVIRQKAADEHQGFWREWVKWTTVPRLRETNAHLTRLKRLQRVARKMRGQGQVTDAQIEQARAVPLDRIVNTPLRKSGKTLVGRCPLHPDRTPSFHVYPASNSWYCYGCLRGGDTIAFIRARDGLSFREAVRTLIHGP